MQKISSSLASRLTRHSVLALSGVALSAPLGSCRSEFAGPDDLAAVGAVSGSGVTPGAGASGLTGFGGSSSIGTGGSTAVHGGGPGSGGAFPSSGGSAGAVLGSGGMSGAKACVDIEPPPNAEWPGATCKNWATETEECSKGWFAQYCDLSCGRCVPAGGGGTSSGGTGSGGMSTAGTGAGGKACVDTLPPPDPEWPGATCAEWATETEECSKTWFASYCNISCGRCVPTGGGGASSGGSGGGSAGSPAVNCAAENLPNVTGGEGFATRYWDCCQPHCSQFNGHRCGRDGVSGPSNQTSACSGGGSFACYDEAPRKVSNCLSYGHIAKSNPNCGGCYRIQFTGEGQHNVNDPGSKLIKGKQMIVKVTNTGGDVAGNQFDLMIPGGGVGMFNACSNQWGTNDLGAQYGGFLTNCTGSHSAKKDCVRQNCMKIPAGAARDGCLWFVDWFEVADNPKFTSQATNCPF